MHGLDVGAYPTLIAQAPKNDARMVVVAFYERFSTVHMGIAPSSVMPHLFVGIAVAVRLLVGLIHHVDAPAVAEFIDILAVGVMRGAQEVDVGLFHQAQIQFVGGIIHVAPRDRMVVVTVYAAQFHILAIDFEHLAHTFHALHTQMIVEMLYCLSLLVLQLNAERVEVRFLGRP